MKISSSKIKEAVNKAIKGASFNNLIPLTSMIGIKINNNTLSFYTTDMTNNLRVSIEGVDGNIDVTVDADKFGKLINKITSDEIDIQVANDVLVIKANGTFKLPLIADEDGLVVFPEINRSQYDGLSSSSVKLTDIMCAYNINKAALAKTLENPCLTGYYCGDKIITTDANVITFNDTKLFNYPILISAQMMQLLTLNDTDINYMYNEDTGSIMFSGNNVIVEGPVLDGIDDFPIDSIVQYLDEAFPSNCKLPKELLLSILDRLSLFIEPYDKNGAYFAFTRTGINIYSKKGASTEIINYIESNDFESFVCCVDIPMLKEQVQAIPEDTIKLYYGNENALKLETGKITQVIALLEDDELDNK